MHLLNYIMRDRNLSLEADFNYIRPKKGIGRTARFLRAQVSKKRDIDLHSANFKFF
jgi:hypothetical protein